MSDVFYRFVKKAKPDDEILDARNVRYGKKVLVCPVCHGTGRKVSVNVPDKKDGTLRACLACNGSGMLSK